MNLSVRHIAALQVDTGEALRERITGHKRLMVLDDEAHHVRDPDKAKAAMAWCKSAAIR